MAVADELIALLGFKLGDTSAVGRYEGILGGLGEKARAVGAFIGTAVSAGTALAAAGLAFLGNSVKDVSAQFESYIATLETIEGSNAAARKSMDWIANFAKTTPYDLAQVTESFVKLKAYGIDPIAQDTLRILGDTASAMGKTINDAVEALADAQTFSFERLKEFGIVSSQKGDEVTFSWQQNGKALTKTVKKNSEEIRAFLLETLGGKFSGAMDKQSSTWKGMVSNMGDVWTGFLRRIGDAGYFEALKSRLRQFMGEIDRLDKEGRLDEWAQAISKALVWGLDIVGAVIDRTASIIDWLISNFERLKPELTAIGIALGLLVAWAMPWTAAVVAIGLAVDDLIAYLQGGESVIGDFVEWIKAIPGAVSDAVSSFGDWIVNLDWSQVGTDAANMMIDALVSAISGAVGIWSAIGSAIINWFNGADWGGVGSSLVSGMGKAVDFLLAYWTQVGVRVNEAIKSWFDIDLIGIGRQWVDQILQGLQSAGALIHDWLAGQFRLPDWVVNLMGLNSPVPEAAAPVPGSGGPVIPAQGSIRGDPGMVRASEDAWDYKLEAQRQEWQSMLDNASAHLAKMAPDQAIDATITDARADNRTFPMTNNVTVNQTVTQPAASPAQAAQAVGQAVSGTLASQRSQIETEPSF